MPANIMLRIHVINNHETISKKEKSFNTKDRMTIKNKSVNIILHDN
jgi:hypothetical protein